ncbi:Mediator of DNA damage checkpoint protein 1 MDC1 [Carpediemonas membranifera]|uniref:Mediator of DNA damage checkpoint protein 1 MDC1 n=1 Tax=Carpediemonas membranifera TaxID=201153 RepID=A0A8J6BGQ0_9EUKA|nr:Mediator of DNA damage checkpoint protein 1 MDC1 [Carpediemonas membranifera]|eukprot:KAG9397137.1 Mediator of DNA damage checkpoint protein 1 MDC1 [Carpediemonas membranifera]
MPSVLLSWKDKTGTANEKRLEDGSSYTLGRVNKTNDERFIVVNHPAVSSKHTKITIDGETAHVEDLKSSHGTRVFAATLEKDGTMLKSSTEVLELPLSFKLEMGGNMLVAKPDDEDATQHSEVAEPAPKKKASPKAKKAAAEPKTKAEPKKKAATKKKADKKADKPKKKAKVEEAEASIMSEEDEPEMDITLDDDDDQDAVGATQVFQVALSGLGGTEHEKYQAIASRVGEIALDNSDAEVIVCPKLLRTPAVLAGLSRGCPVVKLSWLTDSDEAGAPLAFTDYALTKADYKTPEDLPDDYNTVEVAETAPEQGIIGGWDVVFHHSVKKDVMRDIVEAAGGRVLADAPEDPRDHLMVMAVELDAELEAMVEKGFTVVSKDKFNTAVLLQSFEPTTCTLGQ